MMVAETTSTTAVPRRKFAKLFHHVFNSEDPVPLMLNSAQQTAKRWLASASSFVVDRNPHLRPLYTVLTRAFELWAKGQGQFAHYGCMYQIMQGEGSDQNIMCDVVTSSKVFTIPTQVTMSNIDSHSMVHYDFCFRRIILEDEIPVFATDLAEKPPSQIVRNPAC